MKAYSLLFLFVFALAGTLVGCGDGGGSVPEGTPPTPEAGTPDYDKYSQPNRYAPGTTDNKAN